MADKPEKDRLLEGGKIRKRAPRRYTETLVIRLVAGDVERLDVEAKFSRLPRAMLIRNMLIDGLNARQAARESLEEGLQAARDNLARESLSSLTPEERAIVNDFRERYPIARRSA